MDASLRPAKITDRFLAYVVDIVPFGAAFYAGLWYMIVRTGRWANTPEAWQRMFFVCAGMYLLYHALGNAGGATLGKRLFGLRVVRVDGTELGAGRGVLRALGYILSTPMNLGFLWALINRDSRSWHDLLAGSVVIEAEQKSPAAALGSAGLSFALLLAIAVGCFWSVFAAPTPADQAAVRKARQGLEVLAAIEERYHREHGAYTNSLVELARASGDVAAFREAMGKIFKPSGFIFRASKTRYELSGLARDRRATRVRLAGPPQ